MLESIINGVEAPDLLLIKDSYEASANRLVKAVIASLARRNESLCVICYERPPEHWKTFSNVKVVDAFTDPMGWSGKTDCITYNHDIVQYLTKNVQRKPGRNVFLFDSISQLVLHRQAAHTCQMLNRLVQKTEQGYSQVIAVVHVDLHDSDTLSLIEHVASSIITQQPVEKNGTCNGMCSVLHKKAAGKIVKTEESYLITKENLLTNVIQVLRPFRENKPVPPEADPLGNLTFNLTLSKKEKQDRSEVVLPYLKSETSEVSIHSLSTDMGKIFYQPDDADDFDDEDPDDDLDI